MSQFQNKPIFDIKNRQSSVEIDLKKASQTKGDYQPSKMYNNILAELDTGSWCEKNQIVYYLVLLASYVFVSISFATACYWVSDMIAVLFSSKIIGIGLGFLLFVLIEMFDRMSSLRAWKSWHFHREKDWVWIRIAIAIFAVSLTMSVLGNLEGKQNFKATPETVAVNNRIIELKEDKKKKEDKVKDYETSDTYKVKENGKWVTDYKIRTKEIPKLNSQILDIEKEIKEERTKLEGKNNLLSADWIQKVERLGNALYIIIILSSVLYQFCLFYISYYKREKYNEETLIIRLNELNQKGVKITESMAIKIKKDIEKPLPRKRIVPLNFQ